MSTIATTSPSTTSSPLNRLISGHPLVAYFVIAFAGAWLFLRVPASSGAQAGVTPYVASDRAGIALHGVW